MANYAGLRLLTEFKMEEEEVREPRATRNMLLMGSRADSMFSWELVNHIYDALPEASRAAATVNVYDEEAGGVTRTVNTRTVNGTGQGLCTAARARSRSRSTPWSRRSSPPPSGRPPPTRPLPAPTEPPAAPTPCCSGRPPSYFSSKRRAGRDAYPSPFPIPISSRPHAD